MENEMKKMKDDNLNTAGAEGGWREKRGEERTRLSQSDVTYKYPNSSNVLISFGEGAEKQNQSLQNS